MSEPLREESSPKPISVNDVIALTATGIVTGELLSKQLEAETTPEVAQIAVIKGNHNYNLSAKGLYLSDNHPMFETSWNLTTQTKIQEVNPEIISVDGMPVFLNLDDTLNNLGQVIYYNSFPGDQKEMTNRDSLYVVLGEVSMDRFFPITKYFPELSDFQAKVGKMELENMSPTVQIESISNYIFAAMTDIYILYTLLDHVHPIISREPKKHAVGRRDFLKKLGTIVALSYIGFTGSVLMLPGNRNTEKIGEEIISLVKKTEIFKVDKDTWNDGRTALLAAKTNSATNILKETKKNKSPIQGALIMGMAHVGVENDINSYGGRNTYIESYVKMMAKTIKDAGKALGKTKDEINKALEVYLTSIPIYNLVRMSKPTQDKYPDLNAYYKDTLELVTTTTSPEIAEIANNIYKSEVIS